MTDTPIHDTDHLRRKLLSLSALVEENARRCVLAIKGRNREAARHVIDADDEIDALEIRIEEDCVILLRREGLSEEQLRLVVAVLKINGDLERISDLASNVARSVIAIGQYEQMVLPHELMELAERTMQMLKTTLDALVHMDTGMARSVCEMDSEVDALNLGMTDLVRDRIMADPTQVERLLHVLAISRSMERIGDYSTNIAESVVYIHDGHIIRHGHSSTPQV